jgi:site-specific DNA-methyltransferase (adenine-specific)
MSAAIYYCEDAFKMMTKGEPGEFDVVITDPPYPKEVQDNLCSGSLVGTKNVPKYELGFAAKNGVAWLADGIRIAKRWCITFCSVEDFGRMQDTYGKAYIRGGVWYKSNAMGQLTGDRPATAYEGIGILHGARNDGYPKKSWNGRGSYGIWRTNGTRGLKGRHPNQKPIDLALKLVALFSERGETVFDPFCGSGTIGEACVALGRHYIGLDNDREWVARATDRMTRVELRTDEEALKLCSMRGDDPPEETQ